MFNYKEAFTRNIGLSTEAEQERLRNSTVAIPGMGGVGGIHLVTLTRMGIGGFHIADGDQYELANFNRQYGAMSSTLGLDKVDVMEKIVKDINPDVRIKKWKGNVTQSNVDEFLTGCQVMVDSVDAFEIDARHVLYTKAQKKGISVISAGPLGFGTAMLIFTPDSMSFDDYFGYHPSMSLSEKQANFLTGVAPKSFFLSYMDRTKIDNKSRRGPCMGSSTVLCSGFASAEVFKLLLGKTKYVYPVPYYHCHDPYVMKFKRGYLLGGHKNPIQRLKSFLFRKLILDKT